ncbi:MAG TPA: hypothetical protein VHU41_15910 [Thermoanaerobaculia bacterium]|nr:hypothetical protein [Thermoanaerobaculia bacterium]
MRDLARVQRVFAGVTELDQLDALIHVAPRFLDPVGEEIGTVAVLAEKPRVALSLFERVEIVALQVLDNLHLERLLVVEILDHHRHFGELDALRCAIPPLAGDELVTLTSRPDEYRLQNAVLADRLGQLGQLRLVEMFTRVRWRRIDQRQRKG